MNTTSPRYHIKQLHASKIARESRWMRTWRYLHWLSLDVSVGAGVSAAWVNQSWGGEHSWWATIALCAGALWVYSIDHWADGLKAAQRPPDLLSPRRLFYVTARLALLTLALISIGVGIWAALHLPWSILGFGASLTLVCGAYLWLTQRRHDSHRPIRYPKEMIVTSLYALALTAWPLSQGLSNGAALNISLGALTSLLIFCLAWSNVCLISAHERRADAAEGAPSLALWLGEYTTRNIGRGVLKLGFSLWCARLYFLFTDHSISLSTWSRLTAAADPLVSGAMLYTLWRLYSRPAWSAAHSRYRRWADAIFLYPILLLLVELWTV